MHFKLGVRKVLRKVLPVPLYRLLRALLHRQPRARVGLSSFGNRRRLTPVSHKFGEDRGQPIDRYYIEAFLGRHVDDIQGRVLEVKDASYTRRYGGERVNVSEVLDVAEDNPQATIVADLTHAHAIATNAFDCIILTQTLQLIYDVHAAVQTLHRILKPGGVLLATLPGVSQIAYGECGDSWCWGFTQLSVRRLFEEAFSETDIQIEAHGNVLTAVSFLQGLAVEELRQEELEYRDSDYEMLITIRAIKSRVTT